MSRKLNIILDKCEFGYGFSVRKPVYTSECVCVLDVYPGGCADQAGLLIGDMIYSINESSLKDLTEVQVLKLIESAKKNNNQSLCLEILRNESPSDNDEPTFVGSIAKLAIKGGVSLEELTKKRSMPPYLHKKTFGGIKGKVVRKTAPAGSIPTYSQSSPLSSNPFDFSLGGSLMSDTMSDLSSSVHLTRVGGILGGELNDANLLKSCRNKSIDNWNESMFRIQQSSIPQPYRSPKDTFRDSYTDERSAKKRSNSQNRILFQSPRITEDSTGQNPSQPDKSHEKPVPKCSANYNKVKGESEVLIEYNVENALIPRTSSNISITDLSRKHFREPNLEKTSPKPVTDVKWHQVLVKRMPKDVNNHNWEHYKIRINNGHIELKLDTNEKGEDGNFLDKYGSIKMPIKGTYIQWNQNSLSPRNVLLKQFNETSNSLCECQLFRSTSNLGQIINKGMPFKSIKLRFSSEDHAESILKPFVVISSKKGKRHRFGAGYFDSACNESKKESGTRSSSLGIAGPPGATPLCIAAETLGFSFGLSISKNLKNSPRFYSKRKNLTTSMESNLLSEMRKTNDKSSTEEKEAHSTISNTYAIEEDSKQHTSNESTEKTPSKSKKPVKPQLDRSRDETVEKTALGKRLSFDVKHESSKSDPKHATNHDHSRTLRKGSIFSSLFEKKESNILSAKNATKPLIQENEISESQIEETNELTTFDEGIGVASLVAVPVNVASSAIPIQNAPALVSLSVTEKANSAHKTHSKGGSKVKNNSLTIPKNVEDSWKSPILPNGNVKLHKIPRSTVSPFVPFVVELCVTIVERFGLNCVGIYRMSGSKVAHDFINHELSKEISEIDLESEKWNDIYSVSCVLKTFIRNLPDSLFPRQMYSEFLSACRIEDREKRLLSIQRLLGIMECYPDHPEFRVHRATLRYLVSHLGRVSAKQSINKMTPHNLALIFAPNLLQPVTETPEIIIQDSTFIIWLVETLIRYHDWIFSPDLGLESGCSIPPDLDEIPIPQVTDIETSMPSNSEVGRVEGDVRPVVADLLQAALFLPPPLTDLESAEEPGPDTDRPADLDAVRLQIKAESNSFKKE